MIRIHLKLVLAVTAAFLALNVSARALGNTQPPNQATAGFTIGCEGKPQPCWYGIVPGVTTVEEALSILNQYDELFSRQYNSERRSDEYVVREEHQAVTCGFFVNIRAVEIHCSNLSLGDLITGWDNRLNTISGRDIYYDVELEMFTRQWIIRGTKDRIYIVSPSQHRSCLTTIAGWSQYRHWKFNSYCG